MRTPILYDITCMVPIFSKPVKRKERGELLQKICVVFPYTDSIFRGKLLNQGLNCSLFVLFGNKQRNNKTRTSTLCKRYLRKSGIQDHCILQSDCTNRKEYVKEAITMAEFVLGHKEFDVVILSSHDDITKIMCRLRRAKRRGYLDYHGKITMRCEYPTIDLNESPSSSDNVLPGSFRTESRSLQDSDSTLLDELR